MNASIYFGRFFGLYLLFLGVTLIVRGNSFRVVIHEVIKSPALIMFSGVIALILGIFLVLAHNIWEWSYRLVVTLLSYLILIQGLIRLYAPEWTKGLAPYFDHVKVIRIIGLILTIIGIYLIVCTFQGYS